MSTFGNFMGRHRATAHAGSEVSTNALIAAEGRHVRRLAIKDMEDQLWRLERVLTAMASLLREAGVTPAALEARTLQLAREWYGSDPAE